MRASKRFAPLSLTLVGLFALTACGAEDDPATADVPVTTSAAPTTDGELDEDHGDEDHDDEEHGEQDKEHSDDEHGDDDSEHSDDDHDEHGDGDHDEKHDDDDDHDHDDEHDHDDDSSGLGAHEHGTAEMTVAAIDGQVSIDLVSPTFNVFGFEYEPTTEDDLATEAARTTALTSDGVIAINSEAGCELNGPATTEVERDGTHSEITVSWQYDCSDADQINQIDAGGLFAEFENFEDVDVQWVTDSEQSSAELSPSQTSFSL